MAVEAQTDKTARKSAADGFVFADSDNISMFADQTVDNLMHVAIALGAELWALRRRVMTLEKVLEEVGVTSEDIEKYMPSVEEQARWKDERDIFIKRIFSGLERRGGSNSKQLDMSHDL